MGPPVPSSPRFCSLFALLAAGCFGPLDLAHRQCPCVDGWTCVDGACVQGAVDAATIDASDQDAGTPSCPADAFCEDFEGFPDTNGWTATPDFTRVTYVNARTPDPSITPHRGVGMLRVTTVTPGGQSDIVICPFDGFVCPTDMPDAGGGDAGVPAGITSGELYMRAYLYVPSVLANGMPLTMGHASVLYVGAHRGPFAAGEDVVGFNLDVDRASMYVGTINQRIEPRPPAGTTDTRPPFPRDTWVCVRVAIHIDPTAGSVATYLGSDDVPEVSRSSIDTTPTLPWLHFGVGLGYTENMPNGAALYADDVALGRSPIPCLD